MQQTPEEQTLRRTIVRGQEVSRTTMDVNQMQLEVQLEIACQLMRMNEHLAVIASEVKQRLEKDN